MEYTAATATVAGPPSRRFAARPPVPQRRLRQAPQGRWLGLAQERALVLAAQHGGQRERGQLIDAFMPSIAGLARIYRRSSAIEWNDLIQDGVVGLLRALERFDADL